MWFLIFFKPASKTLFRGEAIRAEHKKVWKFGKVVIVNSKNAKLRVLI